jgi:hypothetical protein
MLVFLPGLKRRTRIRSRSAAAGAVLAVGTWPVAAFAQGPPNTPMPGQHVSAHGGAQVVPSSAAHGAAAAAAAAAAATPGPAGAAAGGGGGVPLASWEQALLADETALAAGAGGKEKAGNAEINPVAVRAT